VKDATVRCFSMVWCGMLCWTLLGVTGGCSPHKGRGVSPDLNAVRSYFEHLKRGTPVSVIEKDLNLPKPTESNAPWSEDPTWAMLYNTKDLVICFKADILSNDLYGDLYYFGDWRVYTQLEVWEEKRAAGIPVARPQTGPASSTSSAP
jgi:hypothetical protein